METNNRLLVLNKVGPPIASAVLDVALTVSLRLTAHHQKPPQAEVNRYSVIVFSNTVYSVHGQP